MSNKTEVLSAKKGFLKPSTRENLRIYWYNFRSNKLSMVGLTIVLISVVLAVFAPYIAPFPEHAGAYADLSSASQAPNGTFWFGTDVAGRDILSRVIFGFRGALKMAVVVLVISVPVGTFLGLLAGYYHHTWVDTVIMRLTDQIIREKKLTAMMVTHNLRYAVEYGDRLLMMHQGHAEMDVFGEARKKLKVEDILEKFNAISIECGN